MKRFVFYSVEEAHNCRAMLFQTLAAAIPSGEKAKGAAIEK
jgi:hypothetical protein